MLPPGDIFAAEGGIHFCVDVPLQLHNTGLGFCADCLAEGDVLGCAMMLAPCSDSQPQQVGGQQPQTCRGSLLGGRALSLLLAIPCPLTQVHGPPRYLPLMIHPHPVVSPIPENMST